MYKLLLSINGINRRFSSVYIQKKRLAYHCDQITNNQGRNIGKCALATKWTPDENIRCLILIYFQSTNLVKGESQQLKCHFYFFLSQRLQTPAFLLYVLEQSQSFHTKFGSACWVLASLDIHVKNTTSEIVFAPLKQTQRIHV